jgi:hypothetical protein
LTIRKQGCWLVVSKDTRFAHRRKIVAYLATAK